MSNTLRAGLAWATPVKPDELGKRLQQYAKVLPKLRALRLCHRYGRGNDVHVTKLPMELEQEIEAIVIKAEQSLPYASYYTWEERFRHYESRCTPEEHFGFSPLWDSVSVELCHVCEEDHGPMRCEKRCRIETPERCYTCTQNINPDNCMNTCTALASTEVNERAQDIFWSTPEMDDPANQDCEGWERAIDQSKGGAFAEYDKILQEQFGLNAFFSATRISAQDAETWPRHVNHQFHRKEELRTTLCYLTLSQVLAAPKNYVSSNFEDEIHGVDIVSARVINVGRPSFDQQERITKRFKRALKVLDLKPYFHPSQSTSIVMPPMTQRDHVEQKDCTQAEMWPALVVIAESSARCG